MYDKYLKELEIIIEKGDYFIDLDRSAKLLDLIIKIKTIQALDTSAELIANSRRLSRN